MVREGWEKAAGKGLKVKKLREGKGLEKTTGKGLREKSLREGKGLEKTTRKKGKKKVEDGKEWKKGNGRELEGKKS